MPTDLKSKRGAAPLHLWDDEWLKLRSEDVIEPERPIIDAHHHIWNRHAPYLADQLLADLKTGHMVRATVFAECSFMYRADGDPRFASVGEVEYINGIAAAFASNCYGPIRACAGIVGRVDLTMGAYAGEVLRACLERAPDRFRGIRQMAGWDESPEVSTLMRPPPKDLLLDSRFREGFAQLGPLGLSFDGMCYHPQLPQLIDLVDAFPDTTVVVNHLGGLVRRGPYRNDPDAVLKGWTKNIRELGKRPNTFMKIGGLAMRSFGFDFIDRDLPPTSTELAEAWRPLVETCIEAFGPERTMFESNFPVDRAGVSYRVLWNTYKRIAASYSESEKKSLFAGAAIRAYRLPGALGMPPEAS
jgi:predicted TIM-barrel fold metal-dependent hydrolase